MKYRVIVKADNSGLYAGNRMEYDTIDEAKDAGRDLAWRWTAVRTFAVIPVTLLPDSGSYWTQSAVDSGRAR